MPTYTSSAPGAFLPTEVGALIVRPVIEQTVSTQISTVVNTSAASFRIPVVAQDPSAAWTAEGAEIPISDPTLDELVVGFFKLAGLSIVSNELLADLTPEASALVGAGIARDISRKLDAAFFGSKGTSTVQPAGLADLPVTGANAVTKVSAGGSWTNADPFIAAVYAAAGVGATLGSFVANPSDALVLAKLKQAAGSNVPLLQPDVTQPGRSVIAGVPMFTSPAVAAGVVWGLPKDRSIVVIHEAATITLSSDVLFTSDRTAIRGTLRIGCGWPHPAAVVRISKA